ncbi:hypothetical protein MTO96_024103 [Rhipicephalus appendiculatus]
MFQCRKYWFGSCTSATRLTSNKARQLRRMNPTSSSSTRVLQTPKEPQHTVRSTKGGWYLVFASPDACVMANACAVKPSAHVPTSSGSSSREL